MCTGNLLCICGNVQAVQLLIRINKSEIGNGILRFRIIYYTGLI